uniref:Cation transporter n=1 Tax=Fervidobacterium thailandense TaxID=1008305 RepID=A0A7C4W412_9BACT
MLNHHEHGRKLYGKHNMKQSEHPEFQTTFSRFSLVVFLNLSITLAEIVGGLASRSLLLISDAFHNLTDALAVLLSYIALKVSVLSPTYRSTFGYKRTNVVVAFVNSSALLVVVALIIRESIERFFNPRLVDTRLVLIIGAIGLVGNLLSLILLHKESHENMNVKSAFLHMLSDTISSVSVVSGALFMNRFNIYWLDPLLTLFVAIFVIRESVGLVLKSLNILTQSVPKGLDVRKLAHSLLTHPMVENVHHVHVWALDDRDIHFEAHVNLKTDMAVSETMEVRRELEKILEKQGITHVTLQFEHNGCPGCGLISQDEHDLENNH